MSSIKSNRALSPARMVRERREQEQKQPNTSAPVPQGSVTVPNGSAQVPNLVPAVSEEQEQQALERSGGRATMLELFKGKPGAGHVVSIHGINASPETMDDLHERAAADRDPSSAVTRNARARFQSNVVADQSMQICISEFEDRSILQTSDTC